MSVACFLALLTAVAALRLWEMRLSRRNQRVLAERGAQKAADPVFGWMVALHAGVLLGAAVEVVLLRRPFAPALAAAMGALFLLANAARWWVVRSLAGHWNVRVMASAPLGVVTHGPYRWVRHPNYAAVFVEMLALPMIHTAWLTAAAGGAAHALVLRRRIAGEDRLLLADPAYRAAMGGKPRFVPGLF